jgi:hypothetical protein
MGMMAWTAMLAGALGAMFVGAHGAWAQSASLVTVLHLSAAGSVQVTPDQFVADRLRRTRHTLRHTSHSPSTVPWLVNELIATGMQASEGLPGIEARAIG